MSLLKQASAATLDAFLEGWFAAFHNFDGLILVLQAFFDETGGNEQAELTAVAGFVFEPSDLERFNKEWHPRVAALRKPYRSALCNAGQPPFNPPDWPEPVRQKLMDDLGILSAETARAGFVVATSKSDYQAALDRSPGLNQIIDSPYTVCAISVLSHVAKWSREHKGGMPVYCWFEKGGYHWEEAQRFVGALTSISVSAGQFEGVRGHSWIEKPDAPAFCGADLLAWEWQRNTLRSPDKWSPRMQLIKAKMREASKPIFADHLDANDHHLWAMFNAFAGVRST